MTHLVTRLAVLAALVMGAGPAFAGNLPASIAPPARGAFETGTYRNLLAEIGKTGPEIRAKLDAAWALYFESESDNERLYWPYGPDAGYVVDIHNKDIRTEGMSYAMMIAVQMNRQETFDRLWRFAYRRMAHKDGPWEGYFCWHYDPEKDECMSRNPAPDGEEYFAMALLFAHYRWGSGEGELDYLAHGLEILREMLHRAEDGEARAEGVTNMFDAETQMVVFVPFGPFARFTDPSYHLPAFYHLWSLWGPDGDRETWARIRDTSRAWFAKVMNPDTCLTPDYAEFDGRPRGGRFNPDARHFRVDAWRTVFNWSLDYAWFATDEAEKRYSTCLLSFFHDPERGGGLGHPGYRSSYTLEGTPLGRSHERGPGLIAMNATGALSAQADADWPYDFVRELWETEPPRGEYRYYAGMLYMLSMLAVSGEYRIYGP